MKLLALLLAACALAAANYDFLEERRSDEWLESLVSSERRIVDKLFRDGREYKFFYNGQLTTGISGSGSQLHSGTRIQSLVSLVFTSSDKVLLKMTNTRFGKLNEQIPEPRALQPFDAFEQLPVDGRIESILKLTVQFSFRNGVVSQIEFDGEEQPWSANIKRAILNMIQINLNQDDRVERQVMSSWTTDSNVPTKTTTFTIMEETLEGKCETLYTLVPSTESVGESHRSFQVTKSINFDKCERRPEVRYNERFEQSCPSCDQSTANKERSLVSSSVIRMKVVCSSDSLRDCLVHNANVQSQYTYNIYKDEPNTINSFVRQSLELVKTSAPESDIQTPTNKISSDSQMVYSVDFDVLKEQFYMDGQEKFLDTIPRIPNKIAFVKSLLEKLIEYTRESVDEQAPKQIYRLVTVLRTFKLTDLKKIYESFIVNSPEGFTREEHIKIKDYLLDALALCGTTDCIDKVVYVIKKEQVSSIKAAMLVRKLMDTRVVNERMIEKVWAICEKDGVCERSQQIKQAVYLTVGSMMHTMCLSPKITSHKMAIATKSLTSRDHLCPIETRTRFVEKIISKFNSAETEYQKILFIKTLSNAGLIEMLPELNKIIRSQTYSSVIRSEAILALANLERISPESIQRVLLPVFLDSRQPSSVRMTAVYQLLATRPGKIVLDQCVRQLNSERHPQVFSFVYTMLKSVLTSDIQCSNTFLNDVKLSLRQLRSSMHRKNPLTSWQWRMYESASTKNSFGGVLDIFKFDSENTVPFRYSSTLDLNLASLWSRKFVSASISQSGMSRVLNRLWRSQSHKLQSSLSDLISGKIEMPSPRFNYRSELKEMFNQFNIEPEAMSSEFAPFSSLDLVFKQQQYAFLPVSSQYITEQLLSYISSDNLSWEKIVKMAERNLKDTVVPFSFHSAMFVHEQSRKIATSLGVPLRVSIVVPTVMQATGTLKLEFSSQQSPLNKVKVTVNDFKPSIASMLETKMECRSPIVWTGVKVIAQAKLYAPLEAQLKLDFTKSPAQTQLVLSPIVRHTKEIVSLQTRPISFVTVWPKLGEEMSRLPTTEERTIRSVADWARVHQHDTTVGEYSLGLKLHSRAHWFRMNSDSSSRRSSAFSVLTGPNKYILRMSPGHEMPKEFVITLSGKMFNQMDKEMMRTNMNQFFTDSSENFLSKESSEEQIFDKTQYEKIFTGSEPISNEIVMRLTTKGSPVKREAKLIKSWICDRTSKTCKIRLSIERTPVPTKETQPWKLVSEIETVYPETPLNLNELSAEKRLISRITTKWGSEEQKKFNMKVMAEQSSQLRSLMQSSVYSRLFSNEQHRSNFRSLFSPVGQFKQTLKYGIMDEIKIDVDYKLSSYEQEYLQGVYAWLKHVYYEQTQTRTSTADRLTNAGRLNIKINLDPITRRYMNASITTPFDRTYITDVPVWQMVPNALNLRRVSSPSCSLFQTISRWFSPVSSSPVCEARTNLITMFSKRQMEVPTSTCYSVLAKDCQRPESNKFAVLIKKQSASHERKTLKIVTEPIKLVISVNANEQLECRVNDEQKPCGELKMHTIHNGHKAISCRLDSESLIECQLIEAGISVFFDGYAADIKVSPLYSSSVCGLCGVISSSWDKQIESEPRSLLEKYLLPSEQSNEQCQHEFNERTRPINSWSNSVFGDEDEFSSYSSRQVLPEYLDMPLRERSSVVRPVRRTRVIEQAGQLCFSVKPVRVCPRNTHPVRREQAKRTTVAFTCLSRNSIQADELLLELSERDVLTLSEQHTPSFTETIGEPVSCKHYF